MKSALQIFSNLDALSQAAAEHFAHAAQEAAKQRGRVTVALSGGGTPQRMFGLLAQASLAAQIPWQATHFFWCDERCVPPDHPESNFGQAQRALFQHVSIPDQNLHPVPGEMEAEQASRAYADILFQFRSPGLDWPIFDLVWLGLGADGHTASLFPGSIEQGTGDLQSPTLAVIANYQGRPAQRVTLTPAVFNSARRVVFLVAGADKAAALAQTLQGPPDPLHFPAQRIRPMDGSLYWMVDQEAARDLMDIEAGRV